MKAEVNKNTCIGCGLCTSIASLVFAMDDDGLATTIITDEVPSELNESVQEAASSCPVEAIVIE